MIWNVFILTFVMRCRHEILIKKNKKIIKKKLIKKIMNGENILKMRVLYILKICEKYKKNKKIGKKNC